MACGEEGLPGKAGKGLAAARAAEMVKIRNTRPMVVEEPRKFDWIR